MSRRLPRWRALFCALLIVISPQVVAESVLRIGNGPEPESLDPQRATSVSAFNVLRDLYEGLTRIGADGQPQPAAAQSWRVSADGLRYEFELRPDARWSNGDPLTAEDFVAALRRAVHPDTAAPLLQLLAPISEALAISEGRSEPEALGVQALSPSRLEIQLKRPAPYLLSVLAHPIAYPLHHSTRAARGRPRDIVSNGAYRLQAWQLQAQIELRRNPFYWADTRTRIDRVLYLPSDDVNAELKRYRAGELDITYEIPLVQAPKLREKFGAELHVAPYIGSYFYGINVSQPPLANQPRLRRALSLVIDRGVIVDKVMNGLALPAYSWVPASVSGYTPQRYGWADWTREQRLAEARRLYAQAGYSAARPLQLELRYNTHDDHKRIATVVAAMWKQYLGVQTRLINEENKVFLANRRARRLTQVFRAAWIADYDDATSFLDILRGDSGRNDTGWRSARYDALLDAAAEAADAPTRLRRLGEAERLVLDEAPVIPLYTYVSKHLVKPHVQGWQDNALDYHYSKDLSLRDAP